jgi:hypothetical protein
MVQRLLPAPGGFDEHLQIGRAPFAWPTKSASFAGRRDTSRSSPRSAGLRRPGRGAAVEGMSVDSDPTRPEANAPTRRPRLCREPPADFALKASIGCRRPALSICQNVQPLHASRPCTAAPTRWMEPQCCRPSSSQSSDPSARTMAAIRPPLSVSTSPAAISPASSREPNGSAAQRACLPELSAWRRCPVERRRSVYGRR